jgi:hypothetical protein
METRDEVDTLGKKSCDNKGVDTACNDECQLLVQLLPLLVNPTSKITDVDTVKGDDRTIGEEGVHEQTNDTTNRVLSEEIEGVVDADEVLDYNWTFSKTFSRGMRRSYLSWQSYKSHQKGCQ